MAYNLSVLKIYRYCNYPYTSFYYIEDIDGFDAWMLNTSEKAVVEMSLSRVSYKESWKRLDEVVALVTYNGINQHEVYACYKEKEDTYYILSDCNTLQWVSKTFMVSKAIYDKLSETEQQELHERCQAQITQKIEQLKQEKTREAQAKALEITREKEEKRYKNLIATLVQNSVYFSKAPVSLEKVEGKVGKSFLTRAKAPIEVLYRQKENNDSKVRENLALHKLNQCPLEFLGRIKYIENELTMCENMGITEDLLLVVRETLGIILSLFQYDVGKNSIQKAEEFLNAILGYLQELKRGDIAKNTHIEHALAKQIENTLKSNTALIENMAKDYHIMYDMYTLESKTKGEDENGD